ncbi:hypothetical protein OG896_12265 [Streptomyces sp. NBC_00669]|uniref:hypothetical protein n=1 Tax=Streptomyces sp. NBC_00669 TaxID=2976011 RepID=UPI002E33AA0A|nr:hypothetical protein [Streptomyces sp. NBC_00669]
MSRRADDGSTFSGIDPKQLHTFITTINSHTGHDGTTSAQPVVRDWMSRATYLGLDTSTLAAVTRHLSWAQDQLPMLRQRLFLAQQTEQPYPGSKHMVEIDDGMVDTSSPAQVRRDSAQAVKLAKLATSDPSKLSNAQLEQLNDLLALHENNPDFAERFATGLGPAGTLRFYAAVTDPRQFTTNPRSNVGLSADQKEREKLLGGLEKSMGTTLATATRNDDPAMRQWKKTMISLGGTDVGDGPDQHVYGFQVMSDLMRNGTYDTTFLDSYGTSLIAFEKANTSDVTGGLQKQVLEKDVLPWDQPDMIYDRMHYGAANDGGTDPMTGFMEALGHNPAASTTFFENSKNFDYLTETRNWPGDSTTSHSAKTIAGYKSLGHALESATMGSPYDANPPQLHRTKDTAKVMTEVVNRYGQQATGTDKVKTRDSGADLLARQSGIGPSLGRITAAYIDDVDWGLDDDNDLSVYSGTSSGRPPKDRAHFDGAHLETFLGTLAHDDDAYTSVTNAQQAYTTSVLNAHPPVIDKNGQVQSTDSQNAIRIGAQLQGIMDRGWIDEYKAKGDKQDADFNESVDKRSERQQMVAGLITGGVFAFAPEPESGIGATIVPLVTDDVHDQIDDQISKNIGDYSDSQHRNLADVRQGKAAGVYYAGRQGSWVPAQQLVDDGHSKHWSNDQLTQLNSALRQAQLIGYDTGSLDQEQGGNLPETS